MGKANIPIFCFFAVCAVLLSVAMFMKYLIRNPAAPKIDSRKKHIVCIGDSITYGSGVWWKRNTQSYPARLQELLGDEYQVLNYGLNARALQKDSDEPYTREKFYDISKNVDADVYIIMLGTNDSKPDNWNKENYEKELKDFVDVYKNANKNADIYLMQPPKAYPAKGKKKVKYGIDNSVIKNGIHSIVKSVAKETGVKVIDLYSVTKSTAVWTTDGIHGNEEGNRMFARYIYSCIFEK